MDQQYYEELRKLKKVAAVDSESRDHLRTELTKLTNSEKAEFARKMKLDDELENPAKNDFRGLKSQKGKVALMEYVNQDQDFAIQTAFLAMENYVFDRFRCEKSLSVEERSAVGKFLNIIFEHESSGHVDSVYDVYIKPHLRLRDESLLACESQVNPAYIPKPVVAEFDNFSEVKPVDFGTVVKCKFQEETTDLLVAKYSTLVAPITLDEMRELEMQERWFINSKTGLVPMPSYSQLRNASNYYVNKFEEHRFLASVIFQQNPKTELLVHIHGLFDSMERADEYRVKESANIRDKVVATPVGFSVLAGDFRANRDGVTMYNPSDPDVELMINGKHNIRRAESNVMKKRTMTKLSDRAKPETLRMIREFNKAKEQLSTKAEKRVREKYSGNEAHDNIKIIENAQSALDKKVNEALQFLDDGELVFNSLKVKGGKMEKGEDYVVKLDS
jgi:hypothetical protein